MRELDLKSDVELNNKKYVISTVDLFGVDHSFGGEKPLLYETMIFAYDDESKINFRDLYCNRYSTKEEAILGHKNTIIDIKNILERK